MTMDKAIAYIRNKYGTSLASEICDSLYLYTLFIWEGHAVLSRSLRSVSGFALGTSLASLKHWPSLWDIIGLRSLLAGIYPILIPSYHDNGDGTGGTFLNICEIG